MKQVLRCLICNRIKHLREANGLTLEQLAYPSGISNGGLSEIESCKKTPNIFTIMKICACLNMTLSDFFNQSDINNLLKKL